MDKKILKQKKESLMKEFDEQKKKALHFEGIAGAAIKKKEECLERMSQLQGSYKTIVELEGGKVSKLKTKIPGKK